MTPSVARTFSCIHQTRLYITGIHFLKALYFGRSIKTCIRSHPTCQDVLLVLMSFLEEVIFFFSSRRLFLLASSKIVYKIYFSPFVLVQE